jgi:hypothetical protein
VRTLPQASDTLAPGEIAGLIQSALYVTPSFYMTNEYLNPLDAFPVPTRDRMLSLSTGGTGDEIDTDHNDHSQQESN